MVRVKCLRFALGIASRVQAFTRRDGAEREDTPAHRARTGVVVRGSANQLPPKADAALLREGGRSVRQQAPVQNDFSKRGNIRRRAGVGLRGVLHNGRKHGEQQFRRE